MCLAFLKANANISMVHPDLSMDTIEERLFTELCSTLINFKSDWDNSTFSAEALNLTEKLLQKLKENMSMVVEMMRALVLHKYAANYLLSTTHDNGKKAQNSILGYVFTVSYCWYCLTFCR